MRRDPARTLRLRVLKTVLTLLSGAVMVAAGYALAKWGGGWAGLLATFGGLLILAASAVERWGA